MKYKKNSIPWNKGLTRETNPTLKLISKERTGKGNPMYGRHRKPASIKKFRLKMIGHKTSQETRDKISLGNKGKKLSKETRERIGISSLGRIPWNKGLHNFHSKEVIAKMSSSQKKRFKDNPKQKGFHFTEEHKAKLKITRAKQIFPAKDTKIEVKIQNFLNQLGIEYLTHKYMNINHGYQCDIFIPSINLVIECDGVYWHKYPTGRDIDHIRTNELMANGFKVLRLWEFEIKEMDINGFKQKVMSLNKMGYFQPKVVYSEPNINRENSIIKYIANRVLRNNKNMMVALTGQVGSGKSWSGLSMCEMYSKFTGIPFDPKIHVISSLKELLLLITSKDIDKNIRVGTAILFDEPQTEANSRSWQSEVNQAFNSLISTFRNQRLVVFFALPYLEMIDKQSRILFMGEFRVEGFNKNTKITTIKPRFLEWNKGKEDFYRKRLTVEFAVEGKTKRNSIKLNTWHIPKPSDAIIEVYEGIKKKFTDELNLKLLQKIELKEKSTEGKNKNEEFLKVKELYDLHGQDYLKVMAEMPHLTPYVIDKYFYYIKKSEKKVQARRMVPN